MGWQAGSIICYIQVEATLGALLLATRGNLNNGIGPRVAPGVLQQVAEYHLHTFAIDVEQWDVIGQAGMDGTGVADGNGRFEQRLQVVPGREKLERASLKLRHLQQTRDEFGHAIILFDDAAQEMLLQRLVQFDIGLQHAGSIAFNGSQWRAQFVGDDGKQVFLDLLGLILARHIVEDFAASDELARQVAHLEETHVNIAAHGQPLPITIIVAAHLKRDRLWVFRLLGLTHRFHISIGVDNHRQQLLHQVTVIKGVEIEQNLLRRNADELGVVVVGIDDLPVGPLQQDPLIDAPHDGIECVQARLAPFVGLTEEGMDLLLHSGEGVDQFADLIAAAALPHQQFAVRYLLFLVRANERGSLGEARKRGDYPAMHDEPEDAGPNDEHDKGNDETVLETDNDGERDIGGPLHRYSPIRAVNRDIAMQPVDRNVAVEPVAVLLVGDHVARAAAKRVFEARQRPQQVGIGRDALGIGHRLAIAIDDPDTHLAAVRQLLAHHQQARGELLQREIQNYDTDRAAFGADDA